MQVNQAMNKINQTHNPVLLIHGIGDTEAVFRKMQNYLQDKGWSVYALNLVPNNGDVGLDVLAQQVADYINVTFEPEQKLDIVGFSMGGIVSRYYVQRLQGIERVQRFITISSPHYGTVMAYGSWRPGCEQMRPHSNFLKDLNSDAVMLKQLNFTSIWTPYDLMIVPAKSSQMPIGTEVIIPAASHPWMLTDSRSLAAVATALAEPMRNINRNDAQRLSMETGLRGERV
ncbi:lipase class 2 [Nostoc cycadae WK-1]|uniref:Lipase class 2 n=2 Tax=Nostoc cycadae TaxID=246795 RepID=A0A2H6LBJ2_9NOSO|nr:lipase class 2 [Nostoc cycadae WK-1]